MECPAGFGRRDDARSVEGVDDRSAEEAVAIGEDVVILVVERHLVGGPQRQVVAEGHADREVVGHGGQLFRVDDVGVVGQRDRVVDRVEQVGRDARRDFVDFGVADGVDEPVARTCLDRPLDLVGVEQAVADAEADEDIALAVVQTIGKGFAIVEAAVGTVVDEEVALCVAEEGRTEAATVVETGQQGVGRFRLVGLAVDVGEVDVIAVDAVERAIAHADAEVRRVDVAARGAGGIAQGDRPVGAEVAAFGAEGGEVTLVVVVDVVGDVVERIFGSALIVEGGGLCGGGTGDEAGDDGGGDEFHGHGDFLSL